jgi:hypothetical protein
VCVRASVEEIKRKINIPMCVCVCVCIHIHIYMYNIQCILYIYLRPSKYIHRQREKAEVENVVLVEVKMPRQ